ncbi:MAG: T9SS type A sorting domain-containing protein [Bacteroidetes bacterium]|nr:T9SS type A sorting domain-containing protein [Bacteroidota bacterium]
MKTFRSISILLFFAIHIALFAQNDPFNIQLEPVNISGIGGLQSYAFGQNNGKWLIIGGRLDGLHKRQPFAAFDVAGNNNQLIVVDPNTLQKWTAPLTGLSIDMQEQLSSTNMEFHQEGDYLYIIGGYGYNAASSSRKTFGSLIAVDVPAVIQAVINGTSITPFFRQKNDIQFAVTGGHLKKINSTYYLVGGNKFDGNYNPMGNPTYTQVYTNAIRKFNLTDDGTNIAITHLPAITDAVNLRRRDYNAVSQILPNREEGITAFSGVFQPTVDLPFLNCVNIDSASYVVNNTFQQHYNHYHCPVIPIYSHSKNEMHTIFFGGIAQFYDSAGVLIKDDNVPFVKTIARVTRDSTGKMVEYKLPIEMPSLLGASAEFILNNYVKHYKNEVIKLDELKADTTLVGYIYGGISSTAANVFFSNAGMPSSSSSQIFKVFIIKKASDVSHIVNNKSLSTLHLQVYPNPNKGNFKIQFNLEKSADLTLSLYNIEGQRIESKLYKSVKSGENTLEYHVRDKHVNGHCIIVLETPSERVMQDFIIEQ